MLDCEIVENDEVRKRREENEKHPNWKRYNDRVLVKHKDEYYVVYEKDFSRVIPEESLTVKSLYVELNLKNELWFIFNRGDYFIECHDYKGNRYANDFDNSDECISVSEITEVLTVKGFNFRYFFVVVRDVRNNFHIVGYSKHDSDDFRNEDVITTF